jgi:hypothetical protein
VVYFAHQNEVQRVQFRTQFKMGKKKRVFFINYLHSLKIMEVIERTPRPKYNSAFNISFDFNTILKLEYHKPYLTPQNVKDKLPTLLLFS